MIENIKKYTPEDYEYSAGGIQKYEKYSLEKVEVWYKNFVETRVLPILNKIIDLYNRRGTRGNI